MTLDDYDELFRESYPRLVALGTAMSGDAEVARELAQETMLRAHRRWDEVCEYDHPGAWLRRVMSNLLIDHHRSSRSERAAVGRVAASAGTDLRNDDRLSSLGAAERWAALVKPLTAEQRVIATMFYGEDASIDTIAFALDMSAGGVKSALFKIRRSLRRALEEEVANE